MMTTKTTAPVTLAALDEQIAALAEAATTQEAVIATAQDTLRVARQQREQMEIAQVLQRAQPAEVEALRKAEQAAQAALAVAEGKLPALREGRARLLATRPQAEALALQARVFALRRAYGPAVAALLEALAAAEAANATVHALEEQARGLGAHDSALRAAARLSTGATNLGFDRLAWWEFLSDGSASVFSRWKDRAKAAIRVPEPLEALLEPEPGSTVAPTLADEWHRVFELMYGGPQPKAPSQNQPAARRFR